MDHAEFNLTAKDGSSLFGQRWQPENEVKAVVCLVHGVGEHSGRYAHVAAAFAQAGIALVTIDLYGHGKSDGKRGCIPDYDDFSGYIDLLIASARQTYPGKPLFLYGHSMGGNLVLNYAMTRKPSIAGIIDSAGVLRTAFAPPAARLALARFMVKILPDLQLASELEQVALSRDPEVVRIYAGDPLVHDRLSPRLAMGMLSTGEWILAHPDQFPPIPLLVMQGTADRIVSPQASQQFATSLKGDVVYKPWEGLFHEIHNEPEKQAVLAYMIAWIEAHLSNGHDAIN
jgi:alpha-beta hydrolase superfamily lysophospholipase